MYADESKRTSYVVAAVEIPADQGRRSPPSNCWLADTGDEAGALPVRERRRAAPIPRELAGLHSSGQLSARLYVSDQRRDLDARLAILERLVRDLVAAGGARLVLERDDSIIVHDRRAIRAARAGAADLVRFDHMSAADEPLLWPADAIAWAWYRDRSWRALVDRCVDGVTHV